jgi:hypothetical protein
LELLLAFSLLIIVVGTTYEFLMAGQRAASKTRDSFLAQSQLRAGVDNITDELRWADAVTAASGTSVTVHIPQNTPFSMSSPYSVTFAYDATGRTVTRQQGAGPTQPVAYNVVSPDGSGGLSFNYYDAASTSLGQSPADLTAVARVRLTVIATASRTSRTLTGDAALRSR